MTVQGQLSYRIADPKRIARSLNFTLSPGAKEYESDDAERLHERVAAVAQVAIQRLVHESPLTEAIRSAGPLATRVLQDLRETGELSSLGVEIQGVAILAIKPTPETTRALEATAREAILLEADTAIYSRRNAAVENERAIKQSELDTEVAVEQKKRVIRETQMDAEASVQQRKAQLREADLTANIHLEEQRKQLVQANAENARTTAEAEVQSSSGIIVSTGLGSTAWMKSVVTGSLAVSRGLGGRAPDPAPDTMAWDSPFLQFAVREPFPSVATKTSLVFGTTDPGTPMKVLSLMPENGVIFSDGIENDFLPFTSGIVATISVSDRIGHLIQ